MHADTTPAAPARDRRRTVSPAAVARLALASVGLLYLVVVTGAVVRLTASGLGCDNWPRCGELPFPTPGAGHHAVIEFSNRVVAMGAIAGTLVTWLAARRSPGSSRRVRALALAAFLGTVAQIPLGGLTVIFDLHPLLVMAHFLLALAVVGAAVVLAVETWGDASGRAAPLAPARLRLPSYLLVAACLVLVVTGALATAAGPHPGSEDVRRWGVLVDAVYVHVRASAVFGIGYAVLLAWAWRQRERLPLLLRGALAVLALLLVQMAVGEIQWRTRLPWGVVLVHVSLAAAVWAGTVALVAAVWRPPARLVRT